MWLRCVARFRVVQCKPSSSSSGAAHSRSGEIRQIKPNANCDVDLIELLFDNYRFKILEAFFGVAAARVASESTPIFRHFPAPTSQRISLRAFLDK